MDPNIMPARRTAAGRRTWWQLRALMAVLPLLAAACSDELTSPSSASRDAAARRGEASANGAEQRALAEVARTMALALSDDGLRQRIRNDLRASRFTAERKLPAQEYLKGASGGILFAKMAQHARVSRDSLQRLLALVRPLELYFPVPAHRAAWTGGENLLVATALEEEEAPSGYDLTGASVPLQQGLAPELPTLVLTTRETRFAEPGAGDAPEMQGRNELTDCYCVIDTVYPPPQPTYPSGLYITSSYINDLKEPWFRGDPEIEVHVHGPPTADNPTYGADLACASAGSPWPRDIDQNTHQWYGQTLLFTAEQKTAYAQRFGDGYNVTLWEDDDTACKIKLDNTGFRQALEGIRSVWGVISILPSRDPMKIGGAFIAMLYENASWLLTNDDFLGVLIPSEVAPWLSEGDNHVLFLSSNVYNGHAVLSDY
jgi:hypothetical protein